MKEVKGIKLLSIMGILLNGILLTLTCLALFMLSPLLHLKGNIIALLGVVFLGFILSILYPAQLLQIRKNYYLDRRPTSGGKVFLHIYRIVQLLFTIFLAFVTAAGFNEVFRTLHDYRNGYEGYLITRMLILLALVATVAVNLIVFFKGWRLLKMVRKNYIDHVMESFD